MNRIISRKLYSAKLILPILSSASFVLNIKIAEKGIKGFCENNNRGMVENERRCSINF